MYPNVTPLKLVLFKASGWDTSKQQHKTSIHAIWPGIVVDMDRANAVRSAIVAEFERRAKTEAWLSNLTQKLQELDVKNTWDAIFDATAVRAKSFRLPFNDKVEEGNRKKRQHRPLLQHILVHFYFREDGSVLAGTGKGKTKFYDHGEFDLTDWFQYGNVRLQVDSTTGQLPPLTHFMPPKRIVASVS
eukprot:gnl/MRDRNA2_/MRDRNA2_85537_c0_seq7.p1 gnl/MRDRNA2_/MRDRNA2_85537_c0~~gnl/MRDRNA2_/MRDRNA2_85537_c0_seq7.p1  ORF type:complete len:219 (+),score=28.92 gnl/MRDRNA2_/MRDRNA2_85537_c0_seq7:95-658(+)